MQWCSKKTKCAFAFKSRVLPSVLRHTVGLVAIASRRYIDWLEVLHRYVALSAWTVAVWASYQPLLSRRQSDNASDDSKKIISLLGRLLFSFFLCAMVLFFEKFSIQFIAGKFHERSYAGLDILYTKAKRAQTDLIVTNREDRGPEICGEDSRHVVPTFQRYTRPHGYSRGWLGQRQTGERQRRSVLQEGTEGCQVRRDNHNHRFR